MENKQPTPRFARNELIIIILLFVGCLVVGTGIQMGNVLFPSISRMMNIPVSTATLLASVWAFTGLLSPLFGPASDRYGHSTFVLIGTGVFTLGNLLCAAAPNFLALLIFQIPVGLGYAIFSFSAFAVVGDIFAYETRARTISILRIATSVVALVGVPMAAAIAGWITARGSFATVGILGFITCIIMIVLLPKQPRPLEKTPSKTKSSVWGTLPNVLRHRSASASLLAILGWAAIPTGVFIYLAIWLKQAFYLNDVQVGLAFSLIGVGALIGNAITATLADRLGKKRASVVGLIILSFATPLLAHSQTTAVALAGIIIFTAALEFSFGSFSALITELIPESRGTLMSLVSLANGIGTGLTPLVMRPLSESGGYSLITLILGAVGLVTAAIVGLFVTENKS